MGCDDVIADIYIYIFIYIYIYISVCVVCNPWTHRDPFGLCLYSRGCKQPIQSCTNEDTGCVLVKSIRDAGLTYLLLEIGNLSMAKAVQYVDSASSPCKVLMSSADLHERRQLVAQSLDGFLLGLVATMNLMDLHLLSGLFYFLTCTPRKLVT